MIEGIVVPLITPFKENGELDGESLEKLINYILPSGINGVFPCSTTGEFQYLSAREKLEVIEVVVNTVGGKVPVYAGVTDKSVGETVSNIKNVEKLRPDAVVVAPLVYRSNRKLPQHVAEIEKMTNLPVILYNNDELIKPPFRRENIRTGILKRISKLKGVVGLKDSSGDMKRLNNYIRSVRGREDFSILVGDEGKIVDGLEIGANGGVPSLANLFPEFFVRLYGAFKENFQKSCEFQEEVKRMRIIIYCNNKIRGGLKASLKMKGIIKCDRVREQRQELAAVEKSSLEEFLRKVSQGFAPI